MRELVRANDPVLLSAIGALLDGAGIPHMVLDQNMSVLEGSIGILQRRVLVADEDVRAARQLLTDAGLGHELRPMTAEADAPRSPTTRRSAAGCICCSRSAAIALATTRCCWRPRRTRAPATMWSNSAPASGSRASRSRGALPAPTRHAGRDRSGACRAGTPERGTQRSRRRVACAGLDVDGRAALLAGGGARQRRSRHDEPAVQRSAAASRFAGCRTARRAHVAAHDTLATLVCRRRRAC